MLGQANVLSNMKRQAFLAIVTQNEPEFLRLSTAFPKVSASPDNQWLLHSNAQQCAGIRAECSAPPTKAVLSFTPEAVTIKISEHPLVWIKTIAVRPLQPLRGSIGIPRT